MQVPQKGKCDLCKREFDRMIDVRGSLSIDNGGVISIVKDLCKSCGDKVLGMIGVSFPKGEIVQREVQGVHV